MNNTKEDKIIETASHLFRENSYLSVGVDKIISESNVAKMTFYKYFPSKDILIKNVLERRKIYIISELDTIIQETESALLKLKNIFLWFVNWFSSNQYTGCMFMKAQEEFPESLVFKSITLDYKSWLLNVMTIIFKDLKYHDYNEYASLFLIIIDGLTIKANLKMLTDKDIEFSWNILTSQISSQDGSVALKN